MPPPVCKVCAESYNSERNKPLLMPCSRSLCHACVLRWLENPSQQCYACLGHHAGVKVEDLKVNFDLLEASLPPPPDTAPRTQGEQSSGVLQIVLQELDGEKYQLCAPATATIKTVKNLIKDQYGFDPPQTRLMHAGSVLQDNRTLSFYGLKTANILQMLTKYEGGRLSQTNL